MSAAIDALERRCAALRMAGIPARTVCTWERDRDLPLGYGVRIAKHQGGDQRGVQVLLRGPLPAAFDIAAGKAISWLDELSYGKETRG